MGGEEWRRVSRIQVGRFKRIGVWEASGFKKLRGKKG